MLGQSEKAPDQRQGLHWAFRPSQMLGKCPLYTGTSQSFADSSEQTGSHAPSPCVKGEPKGSQHARPLVTEGKAAPEELAR